MSAAQIAFDMELVEAFECRENECREETKAAAVKAVEERAAKAAAKAAAKPAEKAAAEGKQEFCNFCVWVRDMCMLRTMCPRCVHRAFTEITPDCV